MGDLHARITAIQHEHRQELFAFLPQCACGFSLDSSNSLAAHRNHLTDMLIQGLGLRTDTAHAWNSYDHTNRVTGTRYVTDWNS